jgi:hypothetical protein
MLCDIVRDSQTHGFGTCTHYKMIIQRKETNGFSDESVLALQAQCASLTSVEQNNTQCDFTGMRIAPWESLSSYLHRFLMARNKAETAGNEYTNDALVDLFLSSLGTDNTAYYSILHTTLENQRADGQIIPFAYMELKFIQLEERHTSSTSSRHERANLAALNPKPLVASNRVMQVLNLPHRNLNNSVQKRGLQFPLLLQSIRRGIILQRGLGNL